MERTELLHQYITEKKDSIFRWGTNDCCTFASDWVEKAKGVNPLEDLGHYGSYDSAVKATKLIKKLGGLPKILDGSLGDSKHPSAAMVGDIVCATLSDGETLGICLGSTSVFLGLKELQTCDTLDCNFCWGL